jgi:hypothetical protein
MKRKPVEQMADRVGAISISSAAGAMGSRCLTALVSSQ